MDTLLMRLCTANAVDDYIYIKNRGTVTKGRPNVDYAQADADFNGYEFEVGRSFTTDNGELQISYGREEVVGTFASGKRAKNHSN
jgi:hypothetical protein